MSLSISAVTIHTRNLQTYAQFLSNLFDIELVSNSFQFNDLTVYLKEDPKYKLNTKYTPEVTIDINENEFEDFKAKYEFYSFRILGMEAHINIQIFNKVKFFIIYDPDMRLVRVKIS